MPTEGVWSCTSEQYHADRECINQSGLKTFADDPQLFRWEYLLGRRSEATPSQLFGLRLEQLVFFGRLPCVAIPEEVLSVQRRQGKQVLVRSGSAWEQWRAEQIARHGEGVELLKADEFARVVEPLEMARDNLRAHEWANYMLFRPGGRPHVAIRWLDRATGQWCRAQLDIVRPDVLVDLKTAADVTAREFLRSVHKWRYHWQAAWYRRGWHACFGEDLPFVFVAARNKPAHNCEVYELDPAWVTQADYDLSRTLEEYVRAKEADNWLSDTHGRIVRLEPERWMAKGG